MILTLICKDLKGTSQPCLYILGSSSSFEAIFYLYNFESLPCSKQLCWRSE